MSLYTKKLKFTLTPDPDMPWLLRCCIHELVDEVWEGVQAISPCDTAARYSHETQPRDACARPPRYPSAHPQMEISRAFDKMIENAEQAASRESPSPMNTARDSGMTTASSSASPARVKYQTSPPPSPPPPPPDAPPHGPPPSPPPSPPTDDDATIQVCDAPNNCGRVAPTAPINRVPHATTYK